MSPEWHKAAAKLFADQAKDVDIIITTALIPGRKAPLMITKEMVHSMKAGSVCVDLAAENGGNIETTVKDAKFVTPNGVTCLGYTDLPSRLPSTSSSLYSNNAQKFLSSVGPMTTKVKDYWHIDHEDVAVRGMLVLEKGKMMWPAPQPAPPAPPSEAEVKAKVSEEAVERAFEERRAAMNCAKNGYIRSHQLLNRLPLVFAPASLKMHLALSSLGAAPRRSVGRAPPRLQNSVRVRRQDSRANGRRDNGHGNGRSRPRLLLDAHDVLP